MNFDASGAGANAADDVAFDADGSSVVRNQNLTRGSFVEVVVTVSSDDGSAAVNRPRFRPEVTAPEKRRWAGWVC